jgi:predicted dehydrogenase
MSDRLSGVTVELDTVVDTDIELARRVARRYGFRRAVADVQTVIDDPAIDAVSVALPNFLGLPVLGALLRAGKHVLGEKPLGRNAAEADELVGIAASSGRVAAVGFTYRRVPALAQLSEKVHSGLIGQPYFARAHYYSDYALDPATQMSWRFDAELSGGGTLLDMASHALDAVSFVLGTSGAVSAVTSCHLDTVIRERPTADGGRAAVTNDDTALIDLRFHGGVLGSVLSSRVAAGYPNDLGLEVFGSDGRAKWSFARSNEWVLYQRSVGAPGTDGPRIIVPGPDAPYFTDTMPMVARGNPTGYGEAFAAEMQDFLLSILNGTPMDTSFEVGARTMHVITAALESARTKQSVSVPNLGTTVSGGNGTR